MKSITNFGPCYVCHRSVWGFVLRPGRPYATSTKARYAAMDNREGVMLVRHSTCDPSEAGSASQSALSERGQQ